MYLGTQNVVLQQVKYRPHGNGQHERCAGAHDASVCTLVLPRVDDLNEIFLHALVALDAPGFHRNVDDAIYLVGEQGVPPSQ
jgi:hypothetical protein